MDFGDAIKALKSGETVSRSKWDGLYMFLYLQHNDKGPVISLGVIDGKVPDSFFISHEDMLAEDWKVGSSTPAPGEPL